MLVLGIETSCDDTSMALLEKSEQEDFPKILAHHSFDQEEVLKEWGGVVPEIAARNHMEKLPPLLKSVLKTGGKNIQEIDFISVTTNPGLLGPLLTGLNTAKTLAMYFEKPINPINHLYAHLEAIHLTEKISYPYLGLLVSGGHSIYFLVRECDQFEILGTTLDDAAGEAFDKGGKLMGLSYPAGMAIDNFAKKGDELKYSFPIGIKNSKNANLSYSGLKTSLRDFLINKKAPEFKEGVENQTLYDICASYQKAIVGALALKLEYALKVAKEKTNLNNIPIVVGGGVACNSGLRKTLEEKYSDVFFVSPKFCTDNGAMIANYGMRTSKNNISFPDCLFTDARGRFISKSDELQKARLKKVNERIQQS